MYVFVFIQTKYLKNVIRKYAINWMFNVYQCAGLRLNPNQSTVTTIKCSMYYLKKKIRSKMLCICPKAI